MHWTEEFEKLRTKLIKTREPGDTKTEIPKLLRAKSKNRTKDWPQIRKTEKPNAPIFNLYDIEPTLLNSMTGWLIN